MGTRHTATRTIAALGGLLLVAGCVPTLSKDDPTAPPAVGAGTLSEDQIDSALPREDQLPEGFSLDSETDEDTPGADDESTAYPASCLDIRLAGTTGKELGTHKTSKRKRSFVGENGGALSVTVTSHDQAVPAQLFDDAGAAQSQCGTFQLIDESGTTSWKLAPLAFPQIGDRTYSARVESTTDGDIFKGGVIQVAGASRGNNLVYVVYAAGPASQYDSTAVEALTKTTIDNIDAL